MSDLGWHQVQVDVPRGDVQRVSDLLFAAGAMGLQETYRPGETPPPRQPWDTGPPAPVAAWTRILAWYEQPDQPRVDALMAPHPTVWTFEPGRDWEAEWRASFRPKQVSPRVVIAPPWDAPEGAIIIEPGQGFGTGEHPTTLGALRRLDALADTHHTVLDLGCGSGILAIAAAKLGCEAWGVDNEVRAVQDSHDNARLNGVTLDFSDTPIEALQRPAELVLANLYAEVLVALAPHILRLTQRRLVVAGVLADREHLVLNAFASLKIEHRDVDGEWICLQFATENAG